MPNNFVRVHNQKDTDVSWSKLNPILLDGEIILVSMGEVIRFKVGDGITHYNNLPFLDTKISEDLFEKVNKVFATKLDNKTSPDNVGKILKVDAEGNIILADLKISEGGEVTIASIPGLSGVLNSKAEDEELKELSNNVDDLTDKVSNFESELENKIPLVMPVSESGKVLYVDENGNVVPKEIQFSEGGTGGGSGSGVITWGDLINMK